MRVADAMAAAAWYRQLGFVKEWEHRFEAGFPLYVGIAREISGSTSLSTPATLVLARSSYIYVNDVDAVAEALGVTEIHDMPWGRDFEVADPDGNRLRIGTADVATA